MSDIPQQEQIDQYKNEALTRAGAFEELIRTKGWELVSSYYQNLVQQLANDMLVDDAQPITAFESRRREIIGLRKMMGTITSDLDFLYAERKAKGSTGDK